MSPNVSQVGSSTQHFDESINLFQEDLSFAVVQSSHSSQVAGDYFTSVMTRIPCFLFVCFPLAKSFWHERGALMLMNQTKLVKWWRNNWHLFREKLPLHVPGSEERRVHSEPPSCHNIGRKLRSSSIYHSRRCFLLHLHRPPKTSNPLLNPNLATFVWPRRLHKPADASAPNLNPRWLLTRFHRNNSILRLESLPVTKFFNTCQVHYPQNPTSRFTTTITHGHHEFLPHNQNTPQLCVCVGSWHLLLQQLTLFSLKFCKLR